MIDIVNFIMDYFALIEFSNPEFFFLLILLPIMTAWYIFRRKRQHPSIRVPSSEGIVISKPSIRQRLKHLLFVLRMIVISLLIIVMARPQTSSSSKSVTTEGIDIVMALDVSTSMLAEDFKPNRIEAAKKTAATFINNRINDRIGLVVFAGESFTQCPVTIDHDVLKNLFKDLKSGILEDGTAIGNGLGTATARLKDSEAESKVIILLTDGVNNAGNVPPLTAAEIAKTFDIRVYTIGVGSKGKAPYPFKVRTWTGQIQTQYQNVDVEIDEDILKKIAATTGGKYYRATNNKALDKIYKEIDELEKTKIDVSFYSRFDEEFFPFALAAGIIFFLEILLGLTIFRRLP